MLVPLIPDDSGAIDPQKVRIARRCYYLIFLPVIGVNIGIYFGLVYVLFRDIRVSFAVTVLYIFAILFFWTIAMAPKRKVPIAESPECKQPNDPIYKEIVLLWETYCRRLGYRSSGGVYVVSPIPQTEFGEISTFMVLRDIRRTCPPSLFIAARMFKEFSREELSAAVLHEIGHLRGLPIVLLYLASIFSLPMNIVLRCVGELRRNLPAQWNISVRILYRLERCLHYVSMFAVHHADEYVADMCAVESQNTPEHLIAVLARLSEFHHAKNMEYLHLTQGRFTLDDESHRHPHPTPKDRIRRLRNLRINTS